VGSGPAIMDQKLIAMSVTDRLTSLISDSSGDPFVPQRTSGYSDDQKHHVVLPAFIFVHFLIVVIHTPNCDPLTFLLK